MDVKYPDVHVQLSGEDGDAFLVMSRVGSALKKAKVPREEVDAFYKEASSGNYDHLVQTAMRWVSVS